MKRKSLRETFKKFVLAANLATGEEMYFQDCLPSEAVIRAYLYSTGKRNTWEWGELYQKMYRKLEWGRSTVFYGGWASSLWMHNKQQYEERRKDCE